MVAVLRSHSHQLAALNSGHEKPTEIRELGGLFEVQTPLANQVLASVFEFEYPRSDLKQGMSPVRGPARRRRCQLRYCLWPGANAALEQVF